ncbi:MAG: glycine cleavage system protein [Solirubrobacteraceae bacterium]|jgi:glycine cleavage system H protein|nr:glycine cleavage system protein [Solirubrobacteraceae bacterium]
MAYVLRMATFPEDLRYTETHEWVRDREKLVTVGITQTAADELGPIGFVELPYPGDILKAGLVLCRIQGETNTKVFRMPFTGKMMTVNQLLADQPGLINSDPHGAGWIAKMEPGDPADVDALMDAAAYEASVASHDA